MMVHLAGTTAAAASLLVARSSLVGPLARDGRILYDFDGSVTYELDDDAADALSPSTLAVWEVVQALAGVPAREWSLADLRDLDREDSHATACAIGHLLGRPL